MSEDKVTWSSGNVFADLGLPDAEELSVKAKLALNLQRLMKLHKITQREVAARVGADQPTISKVLRGHLDLVTVDRLLAWLARLDQEVQITVRDRFSPHAKGDAPRGSISVFSGM